MVARLPTRVVAPLAPYAAGFARELASQGYTANSAGEQLSLVAHLSRWLARRGLDACHLGSPEIERFCRWRRVRGYTNYRTPKALRPLLGYLERLGVLRPAPVPPASHPVERLLAAFREYLTIERGLRGTTACGYAAAVRPFLCGRLRCDAQTLDLAHLSGPDVTAFVVATCPQQAPGSAQLTVVALRALLGFLHVRGDLARPLAHIVPAAARRHLARLPKGLEPAQVQRLLATCDRRTRTGRRNFAILTTLVRLGLRTGEVARLCLEDVDWHAGELLVHGKGNREERLPLPPDVGAAMAAYLRRGRPPHAQARQVYLRIRAPHCGLTSQGITAMVIAAGQRAGLEHVHAHRLRHTAATQMLRAGASLPEIGQLLRHRLLITTAIYAKVDRDALRTIARPWPGGRP